jgi:iron complex transport system substrate-binding protein
MRRSSWLAALSGVLLISGLAGCGSGEPEAATGDARRLDSPVTIQHQFGSTTIERIPERIVTIDVQWTDVMLAMGVQPVGYPVDPLMPTSGVPWQRLPEGATALSMADGVPVEQIVALDPDLILGAYSIADEAVYQQLSERAPTIATISADTDKVTPWQDLVRTAGKLLGQPDRAEQVIDDVDGTVTRTAEELPGLKGRTFALAQYIVGDSMYIVADEQDGSSVFFQELGMSLYPPVLAEGQRTGDTRINVSTERADLLRADLLAFLVNGGDRADLADIPGFDQLPGAVAVLDYATIVGLNTPSPLSIPYALEQLRPYLQDAAV